MVSSNATTVDQYLAQLPPERRDVVSRVHDVVRANMPAGYKESMGYGMICWTIPLARYPDTYNGQPLCYVSIAAQKHHYALYLMGLYMDAAATDAFTRAFAAAGKRLDMGKSCVRFRNIDDLELDAVAKAIAHITPEDFIARHEQARGTTKSGARQRGKAKTTTKTARSAGDGKAGAKTSARKAAKRATKTTSRKATKPVTKTATKKRATARAGTRSSRA